MIVEPTTQSTSPPSDKPLVESPVLVGMDVPLFYMTERGPVTWEHKVFCGRAFADTVLTEMNDIMKVAELGLVHLGFYNPRKARRRDGTPISPERWSNHAFGEAVDFKGIVQTDDTDNFLDIAAMKTSAPDVLKNMSERCANAIEAIGRKPEIVDEGSWLHIGIWPK
ncbi:MAG: hypothetical protein AAF563_11080 [Pseudomonadota bacterium]